MMENKETQIDFKPLLLNWQKFFDKKIFLKFSSHYLADKLYAYQCKKCNELHSNVHTSLDKKDKSCIKRIMVIIILDIAEILRTEKEVGILIFKPNDQYEGHVISTGVILDQRVSIFNCLISHSLKINYLGHNW